VKAQGGDECDGGDGEGRPVHGRDVGQ
jgi:hypothetical protein